MCRFKARLQFPANIFMEPFLHTRPTKPPLALKRFAIGKLDLRISEHIIVHFSLPISYSQRSITSKTLPLGVLVCNF